MIRWRWKTPGGPQVQEQDSSSITSQRERYNLRLRGDCRCLELVLSWDWSAEDGSLDAVSKEEQDRPCSDQGRVSVTGIRNLECKSESPVPGRAAARAGRKPTQQAAWERERSEPASLPVSVREDQTARADKEFHVLVPGPYSSLCGCCSVAQSCPTLCNPMGSNTPGLPVLHHLLEFAQVHVHCIGDVRLASLFFFFFFSSSLYLSQPAQITITNTTDWVA